MTTRYVPRAKIVCTLGPASASETVLRNMVRAGMDMARINFSHGTHDAHAKRIATVRAVNKKYRRHVRLLADLEGPRIRLGRFPGERTRLLEKNKTVYLVREGAAGERALPMDYPGSFLDMTAAERVFLDDGNLILQIRSVEPDRIRAKVMVGGLLKERKAANFPGARLQFPSLTDKDKADLEFIVAQGFDYVAQSFVQHARDIRAVRAQLADRLPSAKVVAKIENRQGVKNVNSIMAVSDGIMIARGDMGVCLPIYEVPLIQKRIIREANRRGRLVITATQMLEHMVDHLTPTRAEVTDVANAVIDGTDCVMLSAETAVGRHPVAAVDMMNRIIKHTELYGSVRKRSIRL